MILFLRSNPIAPDPRVEKAAAALSEAGYEVRLLGWDRIGALPRREVVAGVPCERLPIRARYGTGLANLPALLRWQWGVIRYLARHRRGVEIIHACDFDTVLPALLARRLWGMKVVYDIFDFYADHLRATPGWVKAVIRAADRWVIRRVDALILADESRLKQVGGRLPAHWAVILNTPPDIHEGHEGHEETKKPSLRLCASAPLRSIHEGHEGAQREKTKKPSLRLSASASLRSIHEGHEGTQREKTKKPSLRLSASASLRSIHEGHEGTQREKTKKPSLRLRVSASLRSNHEGHEGTQREKTKKPSLRLCASAPLRSNHEEHEGHEGKKRKELRAPSCPSWSLNLVYIGLLQVERGLLDVLAVLASHPDWHLDIGGYGGDEARIRRAAEMLPNVTWHGRIPYERTLELTAGADVVLALYDPALPHHRYASPNKLFEAMMCGVPVLAAAGTGMDTLVERERCGLVIPYGDRAALKEALARLAENPALRAELGRNGRRAYEQHYNWAEMKRRLLTLYRMQSDECRMQSDEC